MREDSATEADLVRGGYRDRLLTELAQNAADAAERAGEGLGHLRVWLDGRRLHVANTGAPLDIGGVHALTALRVSDKTAGVGRFGVGFTAVRAVSEEIEFRSAGGGVRFDAQATRDAMAQASLVLPRGEVPVLRLAWPVSEPPEPGFSSEIVLTLREDNGDALMRRMASEAVDLLLELEWLESVEVAGASVVRSVAGVEGGLEVVSIQNRQWWQFRTARARWLIPVVDGVPTPSPPDVLRAPTRSDEELSLPALLVADVPMQPDRRRVLPGADVDTIADGYGTLLAALPARYRLRFVPVPGFARSEVDGVVRQRVLAEAANTPWLPGASGDDLVPTRAMVLPGITEELASLLADLFPNLVAASMSGPAHLAALAALDVHRIGLASLADMLGNLDRAPSWWGRFYDAVTPLVADGVAADELAALPVPLSDGRVVTGPRTTVVVDCVHSVGWARVVHPDAVSPLLVRLGATEASPTDLLTDSALEALLDDLDWDDEDTVDDLTEAVLTLAADAGSLPPWLGSLPLRDSFGELRAADELLLPDAPLAGLLVSDSPFGVVDDGVARRYGAAALRAVGVGWSFGTVRDELPTGADHDLDDEETWWFSRAEDPAELLAVRDLDLVDESRWPDALSALATDPVTREALQDADGYTAWWLRNHAVLGGEKLGSHRAPSDETFAGLLDPLDHPHADDVASALAPGTVDTAWFAQLILRRLADPRRSPTPAVIARAHRLLAEAATSGRVDIEDLDLPSRVRAMSGDVVHPDDAVVVDRPWFAAVVPLDVAVLSSMATASVLSDLLGVRTASDSIGAEVVGVGRVSSWDREPGAVSACEALGLALPAGQVVVHRDLEVRLSGAVTGIRRVSWWVSDDAMTHCADSWDRPHGR